MKMTMKHKSINSGNLLKKTLFISYSRKDSRVVRRISRDLTELGYEVWIDIKDIQGGDSWRKEITKAIHNCDYYLIFLSTNSVKSRSVKRELEIAADSDKQIIPLMLGKMRIPDDMTFPLAGIQRIDFELSDYDWGFRKLLVAVKGPTAIPVSRWTEIPELDNPEGSAPIQDLNAKQIQFESRIVELESRINSTVSASSFFKDPPSFDPFIQNADKIDICGIMLTSFVNRHFGSLRERLSNGSSIRILLVNPDSTALTVLAERSSNVDIEYYRARLLASLKDLSYLQQDSNKSSSKADKNLLSIRLMPFLPSYGITKFENHLDISNIFVQLYPHDTAMPQPNFELTRKRDGKWYEYFADQFERTWHLSDEWTANG